MTEPLTWKNTGSGAYKRLSNGTTWPDPQSELAMEAAHKARYTPDQLSEKEAMVLADIHSAYRQLIANCQRERNRIATCLKEMAFGKRAVGR